MDKSQFDILSEIRQTLDSLKAQIADIEDKLAEIEGVSTETPPSTAESEEQNQTVADEDFMDPIDISIDIDPFGPIPDIDAYAASGQALAEDVRPAAAVQAEAPAFEGAAPAVGAEPVAAEMEQVAIKSASVATEPEPVAAEMEQAAIKSEPVTAEPEEPAQAPVPEAVEDVHPAPAGTMFADEDMPEELLSPVESINDRQEKKSRKAVMDVMGAKCAWRTAIPGTPVKNVISAISLNDRVLFINTLFKEDPMAFQDAISAFNSMESFAEAEAYVQERHSDWNLNSDLVYRLMMAVRRKLK